MKRKEKIGMAAVGLLLLVLLIGQGVYWRFIQPGAQKQETGKTERDPMTVVWNMGEYWDREEDFADYFNGLLEKYGCQYRVEFQTALTDPDAYGDQGFIEPYMEDVFASSDIVTLVSNSIYTNYYSYYGNKGCFLSLEENLKTAMGQKLYQAYPEPVWEAARIDGEICGIGKDWLNRKCYLVLNQDCLDRHGITEKNRSLIEWIETAREVAASEQEEFGHGFLGIHISAFYTFPDAYMLTSGCPVLLTEEGGTFHAEPMFEKKKYVDFLQVLNAGVQKGYIGFDLDRVKAGNFFAAIQYSYCEEAAVGAVRSNYKCPEEVELTVVSLPEWDAAYDGNGVYTVISAQTEKAEGAFEVLSLCLSEPELSNALAYGREGIEYRLEEGKVEFLEGKSGLWSRYLGNPYLLLPDIYEPADRQAILWEQMETEETSPLMGFRFDFTSVEKEWGEINRLVGYEYWHLWSGRSDDLTGELQVLREKLDEAGLAAVIDEINRQLEEWETGK